MPTRLSFGDYEAWITVEGEEIEHYDVEIDEEKKVATCWIASQEGKHFAISAWKKHTNFGCGIQPRVDGTCIVGLNFLKDGVRPSTLKEAMEPGGTSRLLMFSRLDVTDDDALLHDSSSQSVGEIEVKIRRSEGLPGEAQLKPLPTIPKVHERSKKAMTHRVGFGEQIQSTHPTVRVQLLEVVASFLFRYRSLDMLRANGIAPLPTPPAEPEAAPSPGPVALGKRKAREVKQEEEQSDDDDLEHDELLEATQKLQVEMAKLAEKMERITSARQARKANQPPKKRVKQEPQADARPVFIPGEVIDLT